MLLNSNDSSIFSKPNLFYKISKPTLLNDHCGKIDRTYLHVPVPQCSVFLPEKFLINKTKKKKKRQSDIFCDLQHQGTSAKNELEWENWYRGNH